MIDTLTALDTEFFIAMHSVAHCAFADRFMMAFTGRFIWIPVYVAMAWFLLRAYGVKKALMCLVAVGVAVTLSDQICATLIRPMVERLRPANLDNPISVYVQVVNGYRGGSYGFPSCHAANTFALATFMTLLTRNTRISVFVYVWALINCYTRLYLGVHYPGDLLVGATVGSLISVVVYLLLNRWCVVEKQPSEKNFLPTYVVAAVTVIAILIYAIVL
jgi:undecaprenyl-diphosphatase